MADRETRDTPALRWVRDRLRRGRRKADSYTTTISLFSLRELVLIGWVGVASVIALNALFRFVGREFIDREVVSPMVLPSSWPISVFEFRPFALGPGRTILLVCASTLVFVLLTAYVLGERDGVGPVLGGGSVLLVFTNLLQGYHNGFVAPLAYKDSYYQAAVRIADPLAFVGAYEETQLGLPVHASTHPPGSVLVHYAFDQLFGSPAAVSVAMATVSLVVSGSLLHRLLRSYFDPALAQYVTLLFVLLPAVQIYYLSSLDAIIVALFLGAVYSFTRESRLVAGVGTFCCLALAAWHTFLFVFLLPVLGGIALYRRDRSGLFVLHLLGLAGCYLAVDFLLGYDYLDSFRIASDQQTVAATQHFTPTERQVKESTASGIEAFLLVADPVKYVYTRAENVAEIALFFTPYLCVLWARGLSSLRVRREAFVLSALGVVSLSGLFAAGVYHTGETARGAMYLYPFLLLPVAGALHSADPTRRDEWILAALVFAQTVLMQFIGFYQW